MITNAHQLTPAPQNLPVQKTCFFIDDDEDDRDFFCAAIQEIDPTIKCVFATDGIDAMSQLHAGEWVPDYIFVDMNMPLMDGKQCLVEIKKIQRLQNVPTYLYSTSSNPKLVAEILDMGATDFLIKPTSMVALEHLLKEIVV
ncbi:response regulator [Flavobacterium caeni]|uniref:Response regulator receiver domain-containing protein n=1 Tax=Flavobacterium caeni TaxID=490189 RepID=A0A1G5D109_9FLAO|nr:response regulator [Flavobacterium caeni]SCY08336.1 Response regulator receiver domain-containing protein [Flavobacterium caeni]